MNRLKWISLAVLLITCLIVIFQNIESTEVRILTMSFQLPQAALLLITLAIGIAIGLLSPTLWRVAARRSKSRKADSVIPKPQIPENSV